MLRIVIGKAETAADEMLRKGSIHYENRTDKKRRAEHSV